MVRCLQLKTDSPLIADLDAVLFQIGLHFGYGQFLIVKKRSSQSRIRSSASQSVIKIPAAAGTSRSDDRYIDSIGDGSGQFKVIAGFRSVSVHGRKKDFSRSQRDCLFRPFHSIKSRILTAAFHIDIPARSVFTGLRINCYYYALISELGCTFPDDFRFTGNYASVRKQIGMAVPCRLSNILVTAVLNCLAGIEYPYVPANIM